MKTNSMILIGNTGGEIRIHEGDGKTFATFSVATTDTYKDDGGEWQSKETVWHPIIAFNPTLVQSLKSFKTGTRLRIEGELSYRPFEVQLPDGQTVTKREVSVIARKVEQMPLVKKAPKQEADAA
jgi:single-strand DNA-binding protein